MCSQVYKNSHGDTVMHNANSGWNTLSFYVPVIFQPTKQCPKHRDTELFPQTHALSTYCNLQLHSINYTPSPLKLDMINNNNTQNIHPMSSSCKWPKHKYSIQNTLWYTIYINTQLWHTVIIYIMTLVNSWHAHYDVIIKYSL